jgi:hypothetical protein
LELTLGRTSENGALRSFAPITRLSIWLPRSRRTPKAVGACSRGAQSDRHSVLDHAAGPGAGHPHRERDRGRTSSRSHRFGLPPYCTARRYRTRASSSRLVETT